MDFFIRILYLFSILQWIQADGSQPYLYPGSVSHNNFAGLSDYVLNPGLDMRVVGGDATTIEKIGGFLVSLYYEGDFVCGGTLIEERIVVSAAHCFVGRKKKDRWTIKGGVTKRFETGPIVSLDDFVIPAAFTETNMNMDVSVILLSKPLVSSKIGYAKLCNQKLVDGLLLTVYGWGLTDPSYENPTMTVRTVTVPVIKKSRCRKIYESVTELTGSMLCAGVLGSKDACTYDSGGPIVYIGENTNSVELCGIISFGISCASPKFPGVYTDVNYVRPFIEQTIKSFKSLD